MSHLIRVAIALAALPVSAVAAPFDVRADADGLVDCFVYQQVIETLADPDRTSVPADVEQWAAIGEEMRAVLDMLKPQFAALEAEFGKRGMDALFEAASARQLARLQAPDAGSTYLRSVFDGAVNCAAKADGWNSN